METIVWHGKENNASDLHFSAYSSIKMRIMGKLKSYDENTILTPKAIEQMINNLLNEKEQLQLEKNNAIDISLIIKDIRVRCNIFKTINGYSIAMRLLPDTIPSLDELNMPTILKSISMLNQGLILVTGSTGSGKSTTLASILDHINSTSQKHIITLEDPIEFVHKHKSSIINQIELNQNQFSDILKYTMRQDPDCILIGEIRDTQTMELALTASETGHLVLSTLHTNDAPSTINRIIDVFPTNAQNQIRIKLAATLKVIISCKLLNTVDGKSKVSAQEIMIVNKPIENIIRTGDIHLLSQQIETGKSEGMQLMDYSIANLVNKNIISYDTAKANCHDIKILNRYL